MAVCMICPEHTGCPFFRSFAESMDEEVRRLMASYGHNHDGWRSCVRIYVRKRHGVNLPHDYGPHGKSVL